MSDETGHYLLIRVGLQRHPGDQALVLDAPDIEVEGATTEGCQVAPAAPIIEERVAHAS